MTSYSLLFIVKNRIVPSEIAKNISTNVSDIFLIATGPSLSSVLNEYADELKSKSTFAVNEFCLNKIFEIIKPKYYLFADPAYLQKKSLSEKFQKLQKEIFYVLLKKVTWKMVVFIPKSSENKVEWKKLSEQNENIDIKFINTNRIEGFSSINYFLFKRNMGMPRLQNVLIGAIFLSLNMGYKNIYLLGADHSLHEGLIVDKQNNLYIRTKHFDKVGESQMYYKDYTETEIYKIHEFFLAWSKTFEGYQILKGYADSLDAKIFNTTLESYIDAFQKINIKDVLR
jgi:hypothetical protein